MPRVTIIPRQQPTSTSSSSSTTSTNTSSPSPSASSSPTSSSPSSTSTVTGSPSSSTTSTSTVNTSAFFPDPSQRVQPSKDSSELPKVHICPLCVLFFLFGSMVPYRKISLVFVVHRANNYTPSIRPSIHLLNYALLRHA
ncbi:hypothetical protein K435DRAFT_31190 [Dendrothele bispora CBS 962.96]|uniref:Uncharacterized protein n=1 Tax=Dendrothele bispora (strain CBS 962.96) TaxID=1314807 RepID=A0A4S8KTW6_DENBC|nr:hypothetical protein K435DRAFT_31190 [Dendrothele bispora CBS 962.96]